MIRRFVIHYGGVAAVVLLTAAVWFSWFDILQVKEKSMEPGLRDGQTILVNKMAYRNPFGKTTLPRPDDIVVFRNPLDHQLVVKRCRLLPGEPVRISRDGWLMVEDDEYFLTRSQKTLLSTIPAVPEDSILVLGDNPFHSVDSRDYGCIPVYKIRGKVIALPGRKN